MLVYQPSQPVQNPVLQLMILVRIYYIHQTLIHTEVYAGDYRRFIGCHSLNCNFHSG